MEVIKHGKYYKTFICKSCGCEFVANFREATMNTFTQNDGTNKTCLTANCPECGVICTTDL